MKTPFNTVDEYISNQSPEVKNLLEQIRKTIQQAAPEAEEVISYQMPAYKFHGVLVYFAAFKNHIGFYATLKGNAEFKVALSTYKQGKGSVQFPIDKPMPLDLITEIVKFRVTENQNKLKK